jgi:hypothetical protein
MYRKKINELAVTLEKINYLYRTIRKSEQTPKKVELALLKKYVQDLYDGVVDLEMPTTAAEPTKAALPEIEKTIEAVPVPVVIEQVTEISLPTLQDEPVLATPIVEETFIEAEPIVVAEEKQTANDTGSVGKSNGILADLKEKVADLQEDMAHLKDNLSDTYQNAINAITQKNDDTDKTPYKDAASHFINDDDDDDMSSSKTQILDDKRIYGSGQLNLSHSLLDNDDDETIALNVKNIPTPPQQEAPALIDRLGKGDSTRVEFPISFNQRHAFVNLLFGGDEAAYSRAINELSSSKGYIEALTYINLNIRYDYKWRDDEPAVKEFLEIIKHTFWG